jgi:hypothetical protein
MDAQNVSHKAKHTTHSNKEKKKENKKVHLNHKKKQGPKNPKKFF